MSISGIAKSILTNTNTSVHIPVVQLVKLPDKVVQTFNDPAAVKVLTSIDAEGRPHAIVCGSIRAVAPNVLIVAEILMKTTSANLKRNSKVALLATVGMTSYLVKAKVKERVSSGPMLDDMNKALAAMKLKASAVWVFMPTAAFDQSANPKAGAKVA
jgi:predicted pyridoxine 5'-phosphate oxidase superfamily flavin-nucleotide-binding protein